MAANPPIPSNQSEPQYKCRQCDRIALVSQTRCPCGVRKGDWWCPNCKFLLYAFKHKCSKCGASRPLPDGLNPPPPRITHLKGDWDCPLCGKHQFARNTKCRDCGAPKGSLQSKVSSASDPQEECIVCMDRPKTTMLLHTDTGVGHTCVCWECAQTLKEKGAPCPMCRAPIDGTIKNFQ